MVVLVKLVFFYKVNPLYFLLSSFDKARNAIEPVGKFRIVTKKKKKKIKCLSENLFN